MKKIVLLFATIVLCLPLSAQKPTETHRSMTDMVWCVREGHNNDFQYYKLDKENPVVINGKDYLPMKFLLGELQDVGSLREEGKRVYFIFSGQEKETLLYDFGLQVGETVTIGNGHDTRTLTVADADTIYVDGSWVRRLRMTGDGIQKGNYSRPTYWIEGLGSDLGPLYPYGWGEKDFDYYLYSFGRDYFSTNYSALFVETKNFSFSEGLPYWQFSQWNNATEDYDRHMVFWITDNETVRGNGKAYRQMYYSVARYKGITEVYDVPPTYLFGVREEEGRVYADQEEYRDALRRTGLGDADNIPYRVTADGEMILYDFNMEVGDRFASVAGKEDLFITDIKTDIYGRKLFTVSNGVTFEEGRGSGINGVNMKVLPVAYLNPIEPEGDDFYYSHLSVYGKNGVYMKYETDGATIIDQPDITLQIQNPINNAIQKSSGVYDLQGREIKNAKVKMENGGNLPKGVYIVNGRKVIVK